MRTVSVFAGTVAVGDTMFGCKVEAVEPFTRQYDWRSVKLLRFTLADNPQPVEINPDHRVLVVRAS